MAADGCGGVIAGRTGHRAEHRRRCAFAHVRDRQRRQRQRRRRAVWRCGRDRRHTRRQRRRGRQQCRAPRCGLRAAKEGVQRTRLTASTAAAATGGVLRRVVVVMPDGRHRRREHWLLRGGRLRELTAAGDERERVFARARRCSGSRRSGFAASGFGGAADSTRDRRAANRFLARRHGRGGGGRGRG